MNTIRTTRFSGFTIVELIVVIVVIGILASIVTVSYSSSQRRAARTSFESTAQQVKLKLGEYYTDYGKFPSVKGTDETTADSVLKYLKDSNDMTLATAFKATYNTSTPTQVFSYTPCVTGVDPAVCNPANPSYNSSTMSCDNSTPAKTCSVYQIYAPKAAWGGSPDPDIVVTGP